MSFSKEQIFAQLQDILNNLFEIDKDDVTLDSTLYEDLDLDSIDAVDLVVQLQNFTGRKFKPEEFKSVRTVGDVVDTIIAALAQD
ncbi:MULTISPECIES: acyl carrier protein [Francisella]|uniref:Acyl carrier protein n=5 Tax=Francisella TaxID=262 RepID=A0AAW3DB57_9GAMM|nr:MULTISPECIES: acyl carrier protein [Francisella]AEI35610.1 Acyl carrier protein (ACP2) [Francisella salina]AJI46508.1 phosphopantetheine attachment site family protein [Francisella philomiragia]AJI48759.1 phosphopantetheine attachment site family protein [Francisella philomiragia]AJI54678.1 phosphopantetheine attachment site family protein [Francisella philomiragia]AJI57245.1 phosphopantetheine attachment site family protein [Francisella philomiragia]